MFDRVINRALAEAPRESIACLLGAEILSIYGAYAALQALDVQVSSDFAVAFALSRPFRRLRLPVEVLGAVALARVAPPLARVRVTQLSKALPRCERAGEARAPSASCPAHVAGWPPCLPRSFITSRAEGRPLPPAAAKLAGVVDRYGAAYFVSARLTGATIVCSLYAALSSGVAASDIMQRLGVESVGAWRNAATAGRGLADRFAAPGTVLGQWAAAVTLSSCAYPASIFAAGLLAPRLRAARLAALARLRAR